MNLINKIELAARACDEDCEPVNMLEHMLVASDRWPRIKAALQAAQEMDVAIVGREHYMPASIKALAQAQRKFRAAMEGK